MEIEFKDLAKKKEIDQKINNLETLESKSQKACEKSDKLEIIVKDNEKLNIKFPKCNLLQHQRRV